MINTKEQEFEQVLLESVKERIKTSPTVVCKEYDLDCIYISIKIDMNSIPKDIPYREWLTHLLFLHIDTTLKDKEVILHRINANEIEIFASDFYCIDYYLDTPLDELKEVIKSCPLGIGALCTVEVFQTVKGVNNELVKRMLDENADRYKIQNYLETTKTKTKGVNYFAQYAGALSEVFGFETKQKRDDWVNFQDELSKFLEITEENCGLERWSIEKDEAEKLIDGKAHYIDEVEPNIHRYCLF